MRTYIDEYGDKVVAPEFMIDGKCFNGRAFTPEDLNVVIPERYQKMFDGKHFKSPDDFGKALMFANCAFDNYLCGDRMFWRLKENECSLKHCLAAAM